MRIKSFTVLPATPEPLNPLLEIASNLWYGWNPDATLLFNSLDEEIWKGVNQNPLKMLCQVSSETLEKFAENEEYVSQVNNVYSKMKAYLESESWFKRKYGSDVKDKIAYFCLEYGLHESLPIYSGGLGVLSGDHLKSASDLGVPLIAVGLLYKEGYFQQYLNASGMQQERYLENDWFSMPIHLEKDEQGEPITLDLHMGDETVYYQIWRVDVGRVPLYLLDTNIPQNSHKSIEITNRLYDGDRDKRIRQEILLGIGGPRALAKLGIEPSVFHINEGHSAFAMFERIRVLMKEKGLSFEEAREFTWPSNVFTTHTPVPAGNERFSLDLVRKYFSSYMQELGLSEREFFEFGAEPAEHAGQFCMTVVALKLAAFSNGVAKLHGKVSRHMWKDLYPGVCEEEVPIKSITNGVHHKSWMSPQFRNLIHRYDSRPIESRLPELGPWEQIYRIPDEDLWKAHVFRKERLIEFARERTVSYCKQRNASRDCLKKASGILSPEALTIGFARRFATYKRGNLILRDKERLKKILTDSRYPVQILFAGKAHPADHSGKQIIQEIFDFSQDPEVCGKIIFLENYDINVARYLVQGVDIWLNNPIRPLEASGTSGMKAAINGGLNFSILDGWWDEAFDPSVGWAIGRREQYGDPDYQSEVESGILYTTLERDIIPLFFDRDKHGVPVAWVEKMKHSISKLGKGFSTHRMVIDYMQDFYEKGLHYYNLLGKDNFHPAKELTEWYEKIRASWDGIHIESLDTIDSTEHDSVFVGSDINIQARIRLGNVTPDDVVIQAWHGPLNHRNELENGIPVEMTIERQEGDVHIYSATVPCKRGGHYGYTIRILPGHDNLAHNIFPDMVKWA